MACSSPVFAADRLTDRDLKALVARIEEGRDRFDNALDDQLRRSILRGPSGAHVGTFTVAGRDDREPRSDRYGTVIESSCSDA
jgi:hypothetical protein